MKSYLALGAKTSSGLFAFIFSLTVSVSLAQAPIKAWDRTFGGTNTENLSTVKQLSNSNYIASGSSKSDQGHDKSENSRGGFDVWVVMLNASGTKIWDKTFGGTGNDYVHMLIKTSDGGFLLGGSSESNAGGEKTENSRGDHDFWLVKLDANGNKQWDKTYGGNDTDRISSIIQTSDGGFMVAGDSESGVSGDKTQAAVGGVDYWIIKLNSSGNKLWDKTYGGDSHDHPYDIIQTSDGGYLLGGDSQSGKTGDKSQSSQGWNDYWIVKLDANGVKTWDKTYGGNQYDAFESLKQTTDGGYILGGYSYSDLTGDKSEPSFGFWDIWLVKIEANGNKQWDKSYGGSDEEYLNEVYQTSDGGYILGCSSKSVASGNKTEPNFGDADYWVIKTDAGGTKLWEKAVGGSASDELYSFCATTDGGYLLAGKSESGIGSDKTEAAKGLSDFWLVKLGSAVSGIQNEKNNSFALAQNFPNPFKDNTTIPFTLQKPEKVTIMVYNQAGQIVAKFQKNCPAGKNNVTWLELDAVRNLPVGNYFYQLSAGNYSITKPMIRF